jgi:hypothetical protein
LEWWASVLSTADSRKINEEYYKYVRDMMLPPDINLSNEEISIDYKLSKLRSKLSMINGLGGKLATKIIEGRPYSGLKDFMTKKICGPAMIRKLIRVNVLDSLFPEGVDTLLEKLEYHATLINELEYENKLSDYDKKIAEAEDDKAREKAVKLKQRYVDKGIK